MKANDIAAKLADLVRRERCRCVDVVPKGWMTVGQIAKHMNRADRTTRSTVARLTESGALEKRMFKIVSGRSIIPVAHYKIKR